MLCSEHSFTFNTTPINHMEARSLSFDLVETLPSVVFLLSAQQ